MIFLDTLFPPGASLEGIKIGFNLQYSQGRRMVLCSPYLSDMEAASTLTAPEPQESLLFLSAPHENSQGFFQTWSPSSVVYLSPAVETSCHGKYKHTPTTVHYFHELLQPQVIFHHGEFPTSNYSGKSVTLTFTGTCHLAYLKKILKEKWSVTKSGTAAWRRASSGLECSIWNAGAMGNQANRVDIESQPLFFWKTCHVSPGHLSQTVKSKHTESFIPKPVLILDDLCSTFQILSYHWHSPFPH